MTTQEFWRQCRLQEDDLRAKHGEFLFVTGLADVVRAFSAGDATEVSVKQAAKLIVTGSHRVSTADEIALHHLHAAQGRMISAAQDLRAQGITKVVLSHAK
jgi:hypothetical protein